MNTFIITSFILNFVHKCVILVNIREDIMASMQPNKHRNLFYVSYKHPIKGRKKDYYNNKQDAVMALAHWHKIELLVKNDMDWQSELHKSEKPVTIQEIINLHKNNVLANKNNIKTIRTYNAMYNSLLRVFPSDTIAQNIRTMTREIDGLEVTGWEIYKRHEEVIRGRSRNGIDSYMNDIMIMFNWAYDQEYISKPIMKKSDRYKLDEKPAVQFKTWTTSEIRDLFQHDGLDQYQRDLIALYVITGLRANELIGRNANQPYKELHWEHINFEEKTMQIQQKSKQRIRETVEIHDDVVAILYKWHKRGYARPLDYSYETLNRKIREISTITGIEFTCHDLRRMKSQIARKEYHNVNDAAKAIGDRSTQVIVNHYAGETIEEQRYRNKGIVNKLYQIVGQS